MSRRERLLRRQRAFEEERSTWTPKPHPWDGQTKPPNASESTVSDVEPGPPPVALRDNSDKAQLGLVFDFERGLEMLVKVMEQGGIKYSPRNWLLGGKPDDEYINSAMRHMQAFATGEFYDKDLGTAHIANAAWNMLALLRLNYGTMESLDPEFDQESFVEKYNG